MLPQAREVRYDLDRPPTGPVATYGQQIRWETVAHNNSVNASGRPLRILGIFAHPDDETLCAGGTFAKYASAGADVRVISLTKGGAGQIRDASVGDPGDVERSSGEGT